MRTKHRVLQCPFCPTERLTRWFHHDEESGLVICEDLNSHKNGCKMRLLCVFSGRHSRNCWSREDDEMVKEMALRIAEGLRDEVGWTSHSWDYRMSIPQHYHIQLELR